MVKLTLRADEAIELEVIDVNGRLVFSRSVTGHELTNALTQPSSVRQDTTVEPLGPEVSI